MGRPFFPVRRRKTDWTLMVWRAPGQRRDRPPGDEGLEEGQDMSHSVGGALVWGRNRIHVDDGAPGNALLRSGKKIFGCGGGDAAKF